MLLTIDVGNTQILMGVYDGEELRVHWRLSTNRARTVDEFGILGRWQGAGQALVQVVVCVDQPRQHDHALGCGVGVGAEGGREDDLTQHAE